MAKLISSYLEEIYDRKETEINDLKDYSSILAWLIQDHKGNVVRSQSTTIRAIAKGLAEPYLIESSAEKETDLTKLETLQNQANDLSIRRSDTVSYVQTRISSIRNVEQERIKAEEIAVQEVEEERQADELKARYRQARTVEEEREVRAELKKELPNSLRSIKGWRTRAGKTAFRQVFGED